MLMFGPSSTVIEEVKTFQDPEKGFAVAYFYFDFNDRNKQTPEHLIRSLIVQLSKQSVTPEAIYQLYSSCGDGREEPTIERLMQTLRDIIASFKQTYIIFDALDECTEWENLFELLERMGQWDLKTLHVLATSRKETEIEDCLGALVSNENRICLQTALVNDDIRAYVHERLQSDTRLKKWRSKPEVQEEIEKFLVDKAGGM